MKRLIFTILIAVATVSMLRAQEPTSLEAIPSSRLQDSLYATPVPTTVPVIEELPAPTFYADLSDSSASMPTSVSPVRRKQRFLPMKRRIDREINKIKFAYAGEIALGLTVSYGTLSSDDTDYLLILDNLNLNGSIFTITPLCRLLLQGQHVGRRPFRIHQHQRNAGHGQFQSGRAKRRQSGLQKTSTCKAVHCRSASISAPMRDWTAKDTSGFSVK